MDAAYPPLPHGYQYLRRLGQGASSTVFLYQHNESTTSIAVKVSSHPLYMNAAAAQSFAHEASCLARLPEHPCIARMYGYGISPNGHGYIMLEYAPNGTLQTRMEQRSITVSQTIDLGIKLAGALATAHHAGILHRDIKPRNILITTQGLPVLSDFGIAANFYDRAATGYSVPWAAPELLDGHSTGTQSCDVYSLAATLYALLSGASPFETCYRPQTERELRHLIINKPLPALNRDDVPADLELLLAKALSKSPDNRFPSALAFARALQHAQMSHNHRVTPVALNGTPAYPRRYAPPHAVSDSQHDKPAKSAKRQHATHPMPPIATTLTFGALIAILALITVFLIDSLPAKHRVQMPAVRNEETQLDDLVPMTGAEPVTYRTYTGTPSLKEM